MKNDEIYNFINPSSCDKLSDLKGKDLQRLIVLLSNHQLSLRDSLGLDKKITYGLELEYENIKNYYDKKILDCIKDKLDKTGWISKYDSTLNCGVEINSPALIDIKNSWLFLDDLLKFLKPYVEVGEKSGGHIHIGTQILGNNREGWLHFLITWSIYENIIYRFTSGDSIAARNGVTEYAMPMMKDFYHYYTVLRNSNVKTITSYLKATKRYQAVNFWNIKEDKLNDILYKNTIEFRSPNSSLNSVVWQNNVNLFTKFILYCASNNYDFETIEKRFWEYQHQYGNLDYYDEIFLDQALEFVDLIFNNNLDKLYFLKQYFKSFELKKENYGIRNIQKKKEIKFSL